ELTKVGRRLFLGHARPANPHAPRFLNTRASAVTSPPLPRSRSQFPFRSRVSLRGNRLETMSSR
ncbi:hypothetical protein, partial [Thermogutta sp.]|uniref:hypothetical protein n=1 Tax=Thermogutta sp. TaxID=1962930 RepID=UPI003C7C3664